MKKCRAQIKNKSLQQQLRTANKIIDSLQHQIRGIPKDNVVIIRVETKCQQATYNYLHTISKKITSLHPKTIIIPEILKVDNGDIDLVCNILTENYPELVEALLNKK